MTGEQFPFALGWIKRSMVAERFNNDTTKRSTLALAVKTKRVAEMIMAKRLAFSDRHYDVERS